MAEPEDIDKLLAEIDALNKGAGTTPGARPPALPASQAATPAVPAASSRSPRTTWTGVAAIGAGIMGWVAGGILPFVGSVPTGLGAALGGAAVAFISGPPTWFRRGK